MPYSRPDVVCVSTIVVALYWRRLSLLQWASPRLLSRCYMVDDASEQPGKIFGRSDDARRKQRTVPGPEQPGGEKPGLPGDPAPRLLVIGDPTGLYAVDQGRRLRQPDAY